MRKTAPLKQPARRRYLQRVSVAFPFDVLPFFQVFMVIRWDVDGTGGIHHRTFTRRRDAISFAKKQCRIEADAANAELA